MQKNINLQDLPQQKLRDLLEFPCDFTFKVMGVHREGLVEYNSVSIDILAENIEQIETLYEELAKIEGVRMVL